MENDRNMHYNPFIDNEYTQNRKPKLYGNKNTNSIVSFF